MRRMRERYQEFGYDGLFDQRHRKRTTLRVPMETAERVLALYRDTYFDLSRSAAEEFAAAKSHPTWRSDQDFTLGFCFRIGMNA